MSDQKQDPLMLALTAMASLPQWPEFVKGFKDRRRQWLEDTKGPQVYQNHAELVAVTARASENDHWITLFTDAGKKLTEQDSR